MPNSAARFLDGHPVLDILTFNHPIAISLVLTSSSYIPTGSEYKQLDRRSNFYLVKLSQLYQLIFLMSTFNHGLTAPVGGGTDVTASGSSSITDQRTLQPRTADSTLIMRKFDTFSKELQRGRQTGTEVEKIKWWKAQPVRHLFCDIDVDTHAQTILALR